MFHYSPFALAKENPLLSIVSSDHEGDYSPNLCHPALLVLLVIVKIMDGLDVLKGVFQPKQFYDDISINVLCLTLKLYKTSSLPHFKPVLHHPYFTSSFLNTSGLFITVSVSYSSTNALLHWKLSLISFSDLLPVAFF